MELIFLFISIILIVYYFVCISYAGIHTSFAFMWILISLVFLFIFLLLRLEKRGKIKINRLIKRVFVILFLIGFAFFLFLEGLIISGFKDTKIDTTISSDCDYIIVLGCLVTPKGPSKFLKYRLEACLELSKKTDAKIIVSGGKGDNEPYKEADVMYDYLVSRGIEESRIIKEGQSLNTNQNLNNCYKLIDDENANVVIVTSNFHIFRAKAIAKKAGFKNVYSYKAKVDPVLFANYMLREAIGITKDFIMGNL